MSETTKRRAKRSTTYDAAINAVIIDGIAYPVAGIPTQMADQLLRIGLGKVLLACDDPAALFAEIKFGTAALTREPKAAKAEKAVKPWPLAWAHAIADADAREAGIKAPVGKKLHEAPGYASHLSTALERVRGADAATLKTAMNIPAVRAHHARITGAASDVDPRELLAAAQKAEPKLAQAA